MQTDFMGAVSFGAVSWQSWVAFPRRIYRGEGGVEVWPPISCKGATVQDLPVEQTGSGDEPGSFRWGGRRGGEHDEVIAKPLVVAPYARSM